MRMNHFDIRGIAVDRNSYWYIDTAARLLVEIDKNNKEVKSRIFIPISVGIPYSGNGVVVDDKVFFQLLYTRFILVYNKKIGELSFIRLRLEEDIDESPQVDSLIKFCGSIFLVPWKYSALVKIDINTLEPEYFIEPISAIDYRMHHDELFRYGCQLDNERWVFAHNHSNKLIVFNIVNKEIEVICVDKNNIYMENVCSDTKYIFVLARNRGYFYILDKRSYTVIKKIELEHGDNSFFSCIIDCGEYILILQRNAEKSYCVNKYTWDVEKVDIFADTLFDHGIIRYAGYFSDKIVWMTRKGKKNIYIGFYDITTKSTKWDVIPGIKENRFYTMKHYIHIVEESHDFNINELIECL